MSAVKRFSIYRYNPELPDQKPVMQDFEFTEKELHDNGCIMVLHVLKLIKDEKDPTLTLRRSCGEGVCGSDGMNINGKNRLACTTRIADLSDHIVLRPLPGLPVIRDLVVDMEPFYDMLKKMEPYLQNGNVPDDGKERLQSPEDREALDGLYECILCGCCSTACPSYWWNPDKFAGPAALLKMTRFVKDSRDTETEKRMEILKDAFTLFRCRSIMNCVDVCPKDLNPTKAIGELREEMLRDKE